MTQMQIVIDISEKDLELFQKTSFVYDEKLLFKQSAEDIKQTNALFRLMDAIKDAKPAQKVGKWIPCKDRLPIDDETVLVTGKMKYSWETEYGYFVDCAFVGALHGTPNNFRPFDFETWNDWYEGQDEYEIIAWMPLPDPWKGR